MQTVTTTAVATCSYIAIYKFVSTDSLVFSFTEFQLINFHKQQEMQCNRQQITTNLSGDGNTRPKVTDVIFSG